MKITLLTGKTFDFAQALGFDIKVIKSSGAKRLNLRIDEREHRPVLTIPKYCSNRKALSFVEDHRDWIQNMLAKLPQIQTFTNGTTLSLASQEYTICHTPKHRGTKIENNQIIVGGEPEFLHRRVKDFIKKIALQELTERSRAAAAKINCTIHHITLKDTKSRWGSCSSKNNINYNWRIILAPDYVIDYLVCHEVAHLAHQNHSAEFWTCVADLCPDWQNGRHWLKVKGKNLYQFE